VSNPPKAAGCQKNEGGFPKNCTYHFEQFLAAETEQPD
jgi:hypothetical protein